MARSKQSIDYVATGRFGRVSRDRASQDEGRRKPGRPASVTKGGVTRQGILQAALKLSKTVALQDLSVVIVARAIDVTPALIHYYIGGRDWLTSGIMNRFYKNLLTKWPAETGEWQTDIKQAANVLFESLKTFPGIAAYLVSNNRFRVFQLTAFW